MKSILLFVFFLIAPQLHSQTNRDASVELNAIVQSDPPRITLQWVPNTDANSYAVNRKLKTATVWGPIIATLPDSATEYIDSTVSSGISYEYRVIRQADAFTGYGYINSGIEVAAVEDRGYIIVLIDSNFVDALAFELERFINDLRGDGWKTYHRYISRNMPVTEVKAIITNFYSFNSSGTKAVALIGHIPVPYSGEINVDGHTDHTGAYPADVYYAEVNGIWTDAAVNNISASDVRNQNIPKDGKFDQGFIPGDVELQIGRIDFFNMTAFAKNETELLRQYLDKDHAYRHKLFSVDHRMLIDDNFGYFNGEAFASGGWRNGGPLVGAGNVVQGDYFPDMTSDSYLWSYGCGPGWYQGAGGVGTTGDFANADLQSVFTMLFGSYFGDWDTPNNFLRAALAQGKTLTSVWSGRPHWEFHHMGLGETIGYSARVTQNDNSLYSTNFGARLVHVALMGDPTLRNDVIDPPDSLNVIKNGYHAQLSWHPSVDSVAGYHVYRAYEFQNGFTRVNNEIIADTFFTDSCLGLQGVYKYMVRAITLQRTPGGTYYNLSQGVMKDVLHVGDPAVIAHFDYSVNGNEVTFINTSTTATSYLWDFDDGTTSTAINPVHTFGPGHYNVKLIAYNECKIDSVYIGITVLPTSLDNTHDELSLVIYPNPSRGQFYISTKGFVCDAIQIYSITGELVFERNGLSARELIALDHAANGVYMVSVKEGQNEYWKRIIIAR